MIQQDRLRLGALIGGLPLYAVLLVRATGAYGFWGDAWWVYSFPYWYRPLNAMYSSATNLKRPGESIYWTSFFELFGANSQLAHFFSILLLVVSCALLYWVLWRAFPEARPLAGATALLSFFAATLSSNTYEVYTDNSRLQMIFYWLAVLACQEWAKRRRILWLVLGMGFYLASVLTYEASAMLVFFIPVLVYPVYAQWEYSWDSLRRFAVWMIPTIGITLVAFGIIRFIILGGGAVEQRNTLPDPLDLPNYGQSFLEFLADPIQSYSDASTLALGVLAAVLASIVFSDRRSVTLRWEPIAVFVPVFFVLGITPYLLAGHPPSARTFSSATFGMMFLLAYLVMRWQTPVLKFGARLAAVVYIGLAAAYHADLRHDFQRAGEQRESIYADLISQAPKIAPNTALLFLDIQYNEGRAAVVSGETGTNKYTQMLFDEPTLGGYFLYYDNHSSLNSEGRLAVVSQAGVIARGSDSANPIHLDSLLIFRRVGDSLVLLDTLSAEDEFDGAHAGIEWRDGITEIRSNMSRILPASPEEVAVLRERVCCNWRH